MKPVACIMVSWTLAVLSFFAPEGLAAEPAASIPAAADGGTGGSARILVLTGNEYPGHNWRKTAPLIARFLNADGRMTAEVNADPQFLASPEVHAYQAIVLNYLNWKCPDPGEPARANLKTFVEGGKGLVIVHNACAAFGDWPEFKKFTGRPTTWYDGYGPEPLRADLCR